MISSIKLNVPFNRPEQTNEESKPAEEDDQFDASELLDDECNTKDGTYLADKAKIII